jgi:hypothetical protein
MKPKPFNVLLTDEHRAQLEHMRIAFGCRSHGDAIRALIDRQAHDMEQDIRAGVAPVPPVDRLTVATVAGPRSVSAAMDRPARPNRLDKSYANPKGKK